MYDVLGRARSEEGLDGIALGHTQASSRPGTGCCQSVGCKLVYRARLGIGMQQLLKLSYQAVELMHASSFVYAKWVTAETCVYLDG